MQYCKTSSQSPPQPQALLQPAKQIPHTAAQLQTVDRRRQQQFKHIWPHFIYRQEGWRAYTLPPWSPAAQRTGTKCAMLR